METGVHKTPLKYVSFPLLTNVIISTTKPKKNKKKKKKMKT